MLIIVKLKLNNDVRLSFNGIVESWLHSDISQ